MREKKRMQSRTWTNVRVARVTTQLVFIGDITIDERDVEVSQVKANRQKTLHNEIERQRERARGKVLVIWGETGWVRLLYAYNYSSTLQPYQICYMDSLSSSKFSFLLLFRFLYFFSFFSLCLFSFGGILSLSVFVLFLYNSYIQQHSRAAPWARQR